MTNQALPGRPPAHDLSAFDLSKQSPEQVAQSFARWKAQRKPKPEAGPARADPHPQPKPAAATARAAGGDAERGEEATAPERATGKRPGTAQYSTSFSALLAAGSEPTVQRTDPTPIIAVRPKPPTASPGRRLKLMSVLAGAASVAALAGGALLELADWRDPVEATPQVARVRAAAVPLVGSLASAATKVAVAEWRLRPTIDLALMTLPVAAPPASPAPTAPQPAIQTAPVAANKPALPARESLSVEAAPFVAKPFVPNVEPTPAQGLAVRETAPRPAAPVAAVAHGGDPRPDALFQHGRDGGNNTATDRAAATDGKPAAAAGAAGGLEARPAGARGSAASSKVKSDPRGEGSGGASVGIAGDAGASAAGGAGGSVDASNAGTGGASDAAGVSSSGSGAGSADGAGSAAGSDAGTEDAGSGDAGGASGSGDADAGDSADGDSAEGDAGEDAESGGIGGALGAVGEALGDALGGGKGNPDSNDKDQRN